MYHYEYVSKKEYAPVRKELIELIHLVQDEVRDKFTFQYKFIGSSERKMLTCDYKNNIGFDFDVNLMINDDNQYSPKELKNILMNGFNKHKSKFRYNRIEDSKRVITIKVVDHKSSKITHSCDFAIVNNYIDEEGYECQEYIHFNKKQNTYEWQEQPNEFYYLSDKATDIKKEGLWNLVRARYLEKKNNNTIHTKKSRSLYAEAINDIYNQYF